MENEVRTDGLFGDVIGTDNSNNGCFGVVPEVDFADSLSVDPAVLRDFNTREFDSFSGLEGERIFPVIDSFINLSLKIFLLD